MAKAIEEGLAKKSAGLPAVSKDALRNRLMVFVKCSVENPTFDSQSKDALTSRPQVGVLGETLQQPLVRSSTHSITFRPPDDHVPTASTAAFVAVARSRSDRSVS